MLASIKIRDQTGFTLIEVLISLAVLLSGALGLAYLQSAGLRSSHTAYLRSQAAMFASDMADRLRSNPQGVSAGGYNNINAMPEEPPDCENNACTAAQMAEFDSAAWLTLLSRELPGGTGSVSGSGAGSLFTLTVSWSEFANAGQGAAQTQTFSMSVMP